MTTHHKDLCPCGSGKRYKHCHLPTDQKRNRRDLFLAIGVVLALIVGVAAWGAITQWRANQANTAANVQRDSTGALTGGRVVPIPGGAGDVSGTSAPVPQGAFGGVVPGRNNAPPIPTTAGKVVPMSGSQSLQPGENPVPWQYDVAKNRHYDPRPGHQHWHDGPPPADTSKTSPTITTNPVVTVGGSGTAIKTTTTTTPITGGSTALAPGENPAPWEYDQAKNRHFDPRDAHRHWHSGPPPPPSERGQ